MATTAINKVEYGDPSMSHLFENHGKKFNDKIIFAADDISNTKVYCKEPYAQEMYDALAKRIGASPAYRKDVLVGDSIRVRAKSFNPQSKTIYCDGVGNNVMVTVPFSEFVYDIDKIDAEFEFDVVVTKADSGAYVGTCKNPTKYREELNAAFRENTWFNVKIVSLIRGGYRALYKGTIECFIPGSHAAANIVSDFQELIGNEMPVMVDNYDWSSRMYVVSYKKYVRYSLPVKIHEIKIGHKYNGRLTSDPTEFGMFIELDGYYTGLAHRLDFADYYEVAKRYKAGDSVEVYVKNVTENKGSYRIVLTFDANEIDKDKLTWYKFKSTCEGKVLTYEYENERKSIIVTLEDGDKINIALPHDFDTKQLQHYARISIEQINFINMEIKFTFCK